ncbi:MAG: hypothetical protein EOM26_03790 [Alphaproteobacteria bacterium]|nr:hypothetical protein [Alphaproteobacteria bacterium]
MSPKKVANKKLLKVCKEIMNRYPQTFAQECGINLRKGDPDSLFQWLCASLLMSTRISAGISVKAMRALLDQGWTSPEKMRDSTWNERQRVLDQAGYTRYKETTATRLGDAAHLVLRKYNGDLGNLCSACEGDLHCIHDALQEFNGVGDVGADIFCREAQDVWDGLYPFLDDTARDSAQKFGLPPDAEELTMYAKKGDYPLLMTGLVRATLQNDIEDIKNAA